MSEAGDCCIRCGKSGPGLQAECICFNPNLDKVTSVNGAEVCRVNGVVWDQMVTGHACAACAGQAVRKAARSAAVWRAVVTFILTFVVSYVAGSGICEHVLHLGQLDEYLVRIALLLAALAATVSGVWKFRTIAVLPDAFGVAFLLEKQRGDHCLPCDRTLYPGADEKAKKRAFIHLCPHSGNAGSTFYDRIWEKTR